MAITEKAIGVIANIGIDVAKEHFTRWKILRELQRFYYVVQSN